MYLEMAISCYSFIMNGKSCYKKYFIGIILIALFFYQFYLNIEIKAYKEEGRMDKVTIANNSMEISKLNKEIEELK